MKRYILASILALGATHAHATYYSAITGTAGANLTLQDNSREEWVDVNSSGTLDAGDRLQGFLQIDSFNPPATAANNSLYVVFDQTFGSDFAAAAVGPGTRYAGTFSDVLLTFVDYTGPTDFGVVTPLNVGTAITDILTDGSVAFTAGLVNPEDFFAFETEILIAGDTDYVADPTLLPLIPTTAGLGNFGAGLSVIDNNIGVDFNRVLESTFSNFLDVYGFGATDLYDVALVNGNFGGICEFPNANGSCSGTNQEMVSGFLNNTDIVVNGVPEPSSLALLGLAAGLLGFRKKSMRG